MRLKPRHGQKFNRKNSHDLFGIIIYFKFLQGHLCQVEYIGIWVLLLHNSLQQLNNRTGYAYLLDVLADGKKVIPAICLAYQMQTGTGFLVKNDLITGKRLNGACELARFLPYALKEPAYFAKIPSKQTGNHGRLPKITPV